jgi:hypothetical protein
MSSKELHVIEEGRGGGSNFTCGSIMRGHRLLLVTITPFSVENASAGKPWRFHSLTSPASERKDTKVKFGDDGISSFCTYTTTNKQTQQNKQKTHPIYIQKSYMNYAEY